MARAASAIASSARASIRNPSGSSSSCSPSPAEHASRLNWSRRKPKGIQAAPSATPALSGETYLGHERAHNFVSPAGIVSDRAHAYPGASSLRTNEWTLSGDWVVERERAVLSRANGRIAYRFHARDLHLVLGPSADGKPVRFKVLVDGKPPLADHGSDIDEQGNGTIDAQRLYQLVRQAANRKDRLFEIEFLDPGAQAYAFTFG